MKIHILAPASDDLIDGFRFYEDKREGLGDYFLSTLYSDIESLRLLAGIHARPYAGFYRALSKRFPFAIYYSLDNDIVLIRAVVDCRRRPSWIRKHLGKSVPPDAGS